MKNCIINYAKDGREQYVKGSKRLCQSLRDVGYKGGYMLWHDYPLRWKHLERVSHSFKTLMFMEAFDSGYDNVLWLDASVVVLKPLNPIFEVIEDEGSFLVENNGCLQAQWAGEEQLEALGCTVEEAKTYLMCRSGVMGFNQSLASCLLRDAREAMYRGGIAYNGSSTSSFDGFVEPRHDQVVFSHLAHKWNLPLWKGGIARYTGEGGVVEPYFEFRSMGGL